MPARAPEPTTSPLLVAQIGSPLGGLTAIADDEGLWLIEFDDRRALPAERAWIEARCGREAVAGTNEILETTGRQLGEYFAGERGVFDIPLHLAGTEFERRVWDQLLRIPAGQTRSYAWIAGAVGKPEGVRAVGRANGRNRVSIVVPCHRVIASDGTLCGYGGGLERKRALLELEVRIAHRLRRGETLFV